jgi:hypothetical protein
MMRRRRMKRRLKLKKRKTKRRRKQRKWTRQSGSGRSATTANLFGLASKYQSISWTLNVKKIQSLPFILLCSH